MPIKIVSPASAKESGVTFAEVWICSGKPGIDVDVNKLMGIPFVLPPGEDEMILDLCVASRPRNVSGGHHIVDPDRLVDAVHRPRKVVIDRNRLHLPESSYRIDKLVHVLGQRCIERVSRREMKRDTPDGFVSPPGGIIREHIA